MISITDDYSSQCYKCARVRKGVVLQDAELAITLLYELGEGASEDAMKPGTGALAQLAQGEAQHILRTYPSGHHITAPLIPPLGLQFYLLTFYISF